MLRVFLLLVWGLIQTPMWIAFCVYKRLKVSHAQSSLEPLHVALMCGVTQSSFG